MNLVVRALQEARPLLLKAHECLLRATDLLEAMSNLRRAFDSSRECGDSSLPGVPQQSFVELGRVWQTPLYEITLNFHQHEKPNADGGRFHDRHSLLGLCFFPFAQKICMKVRGVKDIEIF